MLPDPTDFLDRIFAALEELCYFEVPEELIDHSTKIKVGNGQYDVPYPLDHICYRVGTQERYRSLKADLLESNELLAETLINGRPIATFRLTEPLVYKDRRIELLELPSPKKGSAYEEGYEHVEFAIGEDPANWLFRYPNLDWDKKGLDKKVNSDLRLKLGKSMSVKFHEHSLDYVIRYLDK